MIEEHEGLTGTPLSVTLELPGGSISDEHLLLLILQELGVVSRTAITSGRLAAAGRQELMETLDAFLRSLRAMGTYAQIFIHDAQRLPPDVLQQIEVLSSGETGKLFQILLVGSAEPAVPAPPRARTRPSMARIAAGLLIAAVLGGSAAAVWHYREYATAFVQRVASRQ